jgi:hypothetical protein
MTLPPLTPRIKGALLGGLLLVWVAVAWFQIMNQPEPQRVPLTHKSGVAKAVAEPPRPAMSRTRSAGTGQADFKTPKNIFAPLNSPSEIVASNPGGLRKPRSKKGTPNAPAAEAEAPVVRQPTPEELAIMEARRQLSEFRFLGYLTQQGSRRAFLAKGPETYILKIGEIVDGRILLTSMDATSITLVETNTNQKASIPLAQNTAAPSSPTPAPEAPRAPDTPPPAPPAPEPVQQVPPTQSTAPSFQPAQPGPGAAGPPRS